MQGYTQVEAAHTVGLPHSWGTLSWEIPAFIRGFQENLLKLYPGGRHYFYCPGWQTNLAFAPKDVLSPSSKVVCYTNILKNIIWIQSSECLCSQKHKGPNGDLPAIATELWNSFLCSNRQVVQWGHLCLCLTVRTTALMACVAGVCPLTENECRVFEFSNRRRYRKSPGFGGW